MALTSELESLRTAAGVDWIIADATTFTNAERLPTVVAGAGLRPGTDPLTLRTRVASVSKPVTAATMVLAGREHAGLWTTPVLDYLPELAPDWDIDPAITLTDLLSHTSGIAAALDDDALIRLGDSDDAIFRCAGLVVAAGQEIPRGTAWRYTNEGFWLASAVLTRLRGSTFEEAVRTLVLEPADMTASGYEVPSADQLPPTGTGPAFARVRRASGGLWSTVEDLMKFAAFLYADADLLTQLATTIAPTGTGPGYGLGMFTFDELGVVMHPGDWEGFHACLLLAPAHRFASVALGHGEGTAQAVRDVALRDLERVTGISRPA